MNKFINLVKKVPNFLNKKFLSFPTLQFLMKTKNQSLKNIYINFWILISKRKILFKKFFFSKCSITNKKNVFSFDIKERIENIDNEKYLESLKENGIIILENALTDKDHKVIIENFNNILTEKSKNYRANESLIKYFEIFDISNFRSLKLISDYFTKNIYGKVLDTEAEFHVHKCLKFPEKIEPGDNNMHLDRFLPNMKILYSPFEINMEGAPFCYAIGSHKINDEYINFVKSSKTYNESEAEASFFLKKKIEVVCKSNSIIVALTSGFHGRKSFESEAERKLVFLQYHKSFNKISLLFGK
tara:strand:- start:547 stop:1449 length:903 start_codon:yes stop_codon:yes gene_type:complete